MTDSTRGRCSGSPSLFLMLSALAACGAAACQSTPAPAVAPVSADTWAVVDGREITRMDVESAYRRMEQPSQVLSEEEVLSAKLGLLNDLIVQDLLLARARELMIELANDEVDTAYAEIRKNFPDETFQQELATRNLTEADMREGLRLELLSQKVIDHEVGSKITVTDQEVVDFFNANRAQFNLTEDAYHVAQIVITPVREEQLTNRTGNDATTPQAATAKAQMLMQRLKEGASFSDLAMDYSEDPESTLRGGDLGFVPVSALQQAPPALREAVLETPPGSVNLVSSGGAHTIVLVVAHEKAGQRDLSMPAVRESITNRIHDQKEQLLRTAYLTSLRGDANVVNYLARRLVESQGEVSAVDSATSTR